MAEKYGGEARTSLTSRGEGRLSSGLTSAGRVPSFRDFYRRCPVLVTGHTGFKGSWLSLWLTHLGAEVVGVALPPATEPSCFHLALVEERIEHIECDIRDVGELERIFSRAQPVVVFHLAAQALVGKGITDPWNTFMTNTMGTLNVLEAVRRTPSVRSAVLVTSDKCYLNRDWMRAYREVDTLGGDDAYSASKAAAEAIIFPYLQERFRAALTPAMEAEIASARAGNVIGGGDWSEGRLVPDAVRAAFGGQRFDLRKPQATRPWQHVLEPLSGYLLLGTRLAESGRPDLRTSWNFGPSADDQITVAELLRRLSKLLCVDLRVTEGVSNGYEQQLLQLDSSKARRHLGWRTVMSVDEALESTAAWYQAWSAGEDLLSLTLQQIAEYTALAGVRGLEWAV